MAHLGVGRRTFGQPDVVYGEESQRADWKVVTKAHCSVVNQLMGETLSAAETSTAPLYAATMASGLVQVFEPAAKPGRETVAGPLELDLRW